jgi:FkbM family methyltransferase
MDAVDKLNPTVFLIGAHQGNDIQYLRRMFPAMRLFAFEPLPDAFVAMRQNYQKGKPESFHNVAVSDYDGEMPFYVGSSAMTSSLFPFNQACADFSPDIRSQVEKIYVETRRLDSFCLEHHIEQIDLLYSDAQGAEGMILDGAGDLFLRGAIRVMFLEMMNSDLYHGAVLMGELSERLIRFGYRKIAMFNQAIATDGRLVHADVLWSRA